MKDDGLSRFPGHSLHCEQEERRPQTREVLMAQVTGRICRSLVLCSLGLTILAGGCAPTKPARVAAVALTLKDVADAAARQTDPLIVKEGTPAYLMLLDGLLEAYPRNVELLVAACQAYTSYASSFPEDEGGERASRLYLRARQYGFRALSEKSDFSKAAAGSLDELNAALAQLTKRDVPALFWTANAWAGWIGGNIGGVEAMADLPALEATVRRTLELDGSYYSGGPHLLMGVLLAAKPAAIGGDLPGARSHFERAFSMGARKMLSARVLYAQYYARGIKDRELFQSTLKEVLAAPVDDPPEMTFGNVMAQEKAKRLLEKTEEYFGEPF